MSASETPDVVVELLERSNRLGADRRNTNYGGGNTSAKGDGDRPGLRRRGRRHVGEGLRRRPGHASAAAAWPRSGSTGCGRCGTGLPGRRPRGRDASVARLLRLRAARGGAQHRHCPCTGCSTPHHVDHLHPDSVIALAAAADGEELTKQCFGDEVAWVPWRRPGFELALEIDALRDVPARPAAAWSWAVTGLTTWGETSEACEENDARDHPPSQPSSWGHEGRPDPSRDRSAPASSRLPPEERRRHAASSAPVHPRHGGTEVRRRRPLVRRTISCSTSSAREAAPRVVPLGTSCPDHFIRTKVRPLLLDLPPTAPIDAADRPAP